MEKSLDRCHGDCFFIIAFGLLSDRGLRGIRQRLRLHDHAAWQLQRREAARVCDRLPGIRRDAASASDPKPVESRLGKTELEQERRKRTGLG